MNPVMVSPAQAHNWIGHVVCIGMQNGQYYVGQIEAVKNGELILSGLKGNGTISPRPGEGEQAKINGLLGSLFGGLGGGLGGGAAGAGAAAAPGAAGGLPLGGATRGFGGFMGIVGGVQKYWPMIRMGLGAMRFIMPLLGRFSI